jgi:hypothetical protein
VRIWNAAGPALLILYEQQQQEFDMRTLIPFTVAAAIVAGFAGQVLAATADETSPNDPKFLEQMDRENRGGNSNG